jgi:calcineurin-like phosphoesterase family protein
VKRKLYFTSDWHVGHENSIKFDRRPFKDVEEMHEVLVKNFNHYVPRHGITYFLGDMGMCSNGLLKSVITQLNGTKILVRGNHDGKMDAMYNAGFDVVLEKAQISVGKDIITMTHCPLKGVFREDTTGMRNSDGTENWHGEDKHKNKYSIEDFGQFHLHGHIHSTPWKKTPKIDGRQFDVGVPANNYKPVSISQIVSWISKYNQNKEKK